MNQYTSLTKIVSLSLLLSYGPVALIPAGVRAEELTGSRVQNMLSLNARFNAPAGINISEQKKDQKYTLSHGSGSLQVEFNKDKPGQIFINDKLFKYSLNDSPGDLENKLRYWIQDNISEKESASILRHLNFFFPKAYAFNWVVGGLLAVAVVGVIVALSNNKKNRENETAILRNKLRIARNRNIQDRDAFHIARFDKATADAAAASNSNADQDSDETRDNTDSSDSNQDSDVDTFSIRDH